MLPGKNMIHVWRHPKPSQVQGRCIGVSNVHVDARKAKRLAHRIRQYARKNGGQQVVFTSPLQRCARVGQWLSCWGWAHCIDPRLAELDFGAWEGQLWLAIERAAIDQWCENFANCAPGGGEALSGLIERCEDFMQEACLRSGPVYMVGHAGWINALRWLSMHPRAPLQAETWPIGVPYGALSTYSNHD
jgi:alpha-ribazole phosphatase